MRKLAAHFTSIRFSWVILCTTILCCIFSLVLWKEIKGHENNKHTLSKNHDYPIKKDQKLEML